VLRQFLIFCLLADDMFAAQVADIRISGNRRFMLDHRTRPGPSMLS